MLQFIIISKPLLIYILLITHGVIYNVNKTLQIKFCKNANPLSESL